MSKGYRFCFVIIPIVILVFWGTFLEKNQMISSWERRALTAKPENILKERDQFEKYVSDHLAFRDKLLAFYFELELDFDFGIKSVFIFRIKDIKTIYSFL